MSDQIYFKRIFILRPIPVHISLCACVELEDTHWLGTLLEKFWNLEYLDRLFTRPCSTKFGLNIWAPVKIRQYNNASWYNNAMFACCLDDADLGVEIFFENKGATKSGGC